SLFSYSDADGLSDIVSFDVKLQTSSGGHLFHNGVQWPDGQLTPDQSIGTIGQWSYVAGAGGTSDTIGFNVTDHAGAFNPTVTATVSTQASASANIFDFPVGTLDQNGHRFATEQAGDPDGWHVAQNFGDTAGNNNPSGR